MIRFSGKGENIWDRLTHNHPELFPDKTNGDVACDSYHKYKEDVSLLKDIGVSKFEYVMYQWYTNQNKFSFSYY